MMRKKTKWKKLRWDIERLLVCHCYCWFSTNIQKSWRCVQDKIIRAFCNKKMSEFHKFSLGSDSLDFCYISRTYKVKLMKQNGPVFSLVTFSIQSSSALKNK